MRIEPRLWPAETELLSAEIASCDFGPLINISTELAGLIERSLEALNANPAARAALEHAPQTVRDSVRTVFGASDFVAQACARDAQLLDCLITSGDLERALSAADFARRAPQSHSALPPDAQVQAALRRWRRLELTRIAWRDLAGWAPLTETLAELTAFADTAIAAALAHARRALVERYGEPRSAGGEVQPLLIIGMGKLGGGN